MKAENVDAIVAVGANGVVFDFQLYGKPYLIETKEEAVKVMSKRIASFYPLHEAKIIVGEKIER